MGAYITSVGMTRFGRRRESLEELMCQAALEALSHPGPDECKMDALVVGAMNPAETSNEDNIAAALADRLGLLPVPAFRIENAPATGSSALHQAVFFVTSGLFKRVLVVAGEKMTSKDTKTLSGIIAKLTPEHERNLGITMVALTALLTRRYMHRFHVSREDLSLVPVKNHLNATMNPNAHYRKEITVEDVRRSPMISDPLRLLDCAPISDGAAAAVVSSRGADVQITGIGHGADILSYQHREALCSFPATSRAAERAYSMAGLKPKDVDVLETHDAFSILELVNPEDLGIFSPGEAVKALRVGKTAVSGKIPINPSGGLKAKGHPVGASGLAQVCELFWQLKGEAGGRQVDDPQVAVAHNIGGFGNNATVTILEKAL